MSYMAEQRHPFRFRLPWLTSQRTSIATPQRPRPTSETSRAPSQPATTVPLRRPAFRPAGIAPTPPPPPPQSQPPENAKPQLSPPSSSSAVTESTKLSPSAVAAKPPSPSPAATESPKITSESTSSPSVATTKSPSPSFAANNARKDTSQSTSLPSSATTKPQSPSPATTESPKAGSQAASSPPSTTAKQLSSSSAATESQKDSTQSPSSPSTTTSKTPSPSRAAAEPQVDIQLVSPKATSRLASSPSSETTKPPSPSRVAAESQVKTQAVSPSQARDLSRETSSAMSPSKGHSKSKAILELGKSSQPQSPPHLASQKTTSEVSSPSRKATQREPEPTTAVVTPSSPSPDKPQDIIQDSSGAPLSIAQTQKSAPQEEPKKSTSQMPPQESEPKVEITSGTTEKPDSQDDAMARDQIKISSPEEGVTSREARDESVSSIVIDHNPLWEAVKESKEPQERKEIVQEIPKEEKTSKATNEEPIPKSIIEAPVTRRDVKETPKVARKAPRRQQKQETPQRKETTATTSYTGKQIKTGIPSQPMEWKKPFSFTDEEEAPRQREIKEDISNLICTLATRPQSGEKPVTVTTLIGDNRGASMHLSSEATKKEGSIHIHRGYKTDPDESPESTSDGELRDNGKSKDQMPSGPAAYLNSNVQSVNNSIVFEASVTERSPGVHLSLTQNTAEAIKPDDKSVPVQTSKVEFIRTPSEKLTHQPVVRRRCLRGLFMEPSDSDPDNPDKPIRHGCRYSCGKKSKDKEIM